VREALGRRSDDPVADHLHVADWETLIPDLSEEVVRDLPLVRTRLVSDHPEHAAEYDRLQAEGTLRVALAAPLVLFLVTVAVRDSLFWLLGLLAVLALAREGLTRTEEAGDVIVDALLAGIITAPAVDRVRTGERSMRLAGIGRPSPDRERVVVFDGAHGRDYGSSSSTSWERARGDGPLPRTQAKYLVEGGVDVLL
jgi:hypothetical protein